MACPLLLEAPPPPLCDPLMSPPSHALPPQPSPLPPSRISQPTDAPLFDPFAFLEWDRVIAAPPMRLMDLDDDSFGLIAELSWDGSPAGGLLGACHRAQTVGTAALRSVCLSMNKRGGRRSMLEDAHTAGLTLDVRAPLTAWVSVVLRFLNRATRLSNVILDEDAEPFPFAERAAVWERIGEGLRGHPLRVLDVTGSALAALASRGATARPLRELGLFSWPLEREAPIEASLAAVAPSLDMLLGLGGAWFYDPDVLFSRGRRNTAP